MTKKLSDRIKSAIKNDDPYPILSLSATDMTKIAKTEWRHRPDLYGQSIIKDFPNTCFHAWLNREKEISTKQSQFSLRTKPGIIFNDGVEMAFAEKWDGDRWDAWTQAIGEVLPQQSITSNERLFCILGKKNFEAAKHMLMSGGVKSISRTHFTTMSIIYELTKTEPRFPRENLPAGKEANRTSRTLISHIIRESDGETLRDTFPAILKVLLSAKENNGLSMSVKRKNSFLSKIANRFQKLAIGTNPAQSVFNMVDTDILDETGWKAISSLTDWATQPDVWKEAIKSGETQSTWQIDYHLLNKTPLDILLAQIQRNSASSFLRAALDNGLSPQKIFSACLNSDIKYWTTFGAIPSIIGESINLMSEEEARAAIVELPHKLVYEKTAEHLEGIMTEITLITGRRIEGAQKILTGDGIARYDAACLSLRHKSGERKSVQAP